MKDVLALLTHNELDMYKAHLSVSVALMSQKLNIPMPKLEKGLFDTISAGVNPGDAIEFLKKVTLKGKTVVDYLAEAAANGQQNVNSLNESFKSITPN